MYEKKGDRLEQTAFPVSAGGVACWMKGLTAAVCSEFAGAWGRCMDFEVLCVNKGF